MFDRRLRLMLPLLVVASLVLGLAGCAGTPSGEATASTEGGSGSTASSSTAAGFAAFGDVIPAAALEDAPELSLLSTTRLEDLGFDRPSIDSDAFAAYLQDVSLGFGGTMVFDGLACDGCRGSEPYGVAWRDALGYEPLGFDRIVVAGTAPAQLAVLQGGVDPQTLAAAFDGEEGYTVASSDGMVRVDSTCEALAPRCEDPGPRDRLGRGLHVASDGTWTAISYDPALVDAFVDDGGLAADAPERTALAWADDLDLVAGTAWVPGDDTCTGAGGLAGVTATVAVTGTTRAQDAPDDAVFVYRVEIADASSATATADAVAGAITTGCSTGDAPGDRLQDVTTEHDGAVITVTGTAGRGDLWSQQYLRRDLPFS